MCQAMIEALIYLKVERYFVLTLLITNGFATLMIGLAPCAPNKLVKPPFGLLVTGHKLPVIQYCCSNVDFNVFIV